MNRKFIEFKKFDFFAINNFSLAKSCGLMEPILFNMAFTCIIVLACNLFVIEINDRMSFQIMTALIDTIAVVGLAFTFFYFSDSITIKLEEIGDIFFYSAWYRLPVKQQSLLIAPIQRAQRKIRLRCMGFFDCSLPVFLSVGNCSIRLTSQIIFDKTRLVCLFQIIRCACSYFIIIRSFKQ